MTIQLLGMQSENEDSDGFDDEDKSNWLDDEEESDWEDDEDLSFQNS